MPPEIAVVVPTYRRPELLPRLVAALEAQTLTPDRFEVVVVDDASGDDTGAVLEGLRASTDLQLQVVTVEENRGPGPARNRGWQITTAPYVAFTDDDCVPDPRWLEQALAACRAAPDLGVLQGATHRPPGPYSYGPDTVYREVLAPSPYFEGCNLVFPRVVLDAMGGFDERYRPSGEDTAAGWRAMEVEGGRRRVFEDACIVVHDVVERPFRWHLRMAYREGVLVDVAAHHPAIRREGFWRPWAHREWNAAFVLGVAGSLVALRWPLALVAWLPWARLRVPRTIDVRRGAPLLARRFVLDAATEAGMLRASLRNRVLVL